METILNKTLNHIGITAVRGWRSAAMNTQFRHSGRNCKRSSVCLNAGKYVAGILCSAAKNWAHYKVNPVITVSVCGEPWEVKHASSSHPQVCSSLNFLVCFFSWKTCSENTAILILSRFFYFHPVICFLLALFYLSRNNCREIYFIH